MKTYDDGALHCHEGVHGWQSFNREGEKMIFSQSEEDCVFWTRSLVRKQNKRGGPVGRVVNSGTVGEVSYRL